MVDRELPEGPSTSQKESGAKRTKKDSEEQEPVGAQAMYASPVTTRVYVIGFVLPYNSGIHADRGLAAWSLGSTVDQLPVAVCLVGWRSGSSSGRTWLLLVL
ncbi:hypothetical protein NDU88_005748 [Pleurodeles waltl]|uniref:Uncharacterized protein n=1 Tax=Pleurodeles waltl TaxID=8319 RepID=A0AAV7LUX9_PLEWA|nr:hypothetical protein NDU88_005748 [Pleurodeles waltl]